MMDTVITLVCYGRKFYSESGTELPILEDADGTRYDWGTVERRAAEGAQFAVRGPTEAEYGRMCRRLDAIKRGRK
jgi:hypothetical protein